jgi:hypothetical protein
MHRSFVIKLLAALQFLTLLLSCVAQSPTDASKSLARAREVMGTSLLHGRVMHSHAVTAIGQPYQSDRTYPPFFSDMSAQEIWYKPDTRVERLQSRDMFPGTGPTPEAATVDDGINAEMIRGERSVPIHRLQATQRDLDPWAVIADWSAASDVKVSGTEVYRDYPRVVLARRTADGEQRLFVDAKSGYPVKLDLVEPHYLWGQQHVEYVWSTWITNKDGVSYPGAAFRVVDGEVEISRTIGDLELVAAEAAPALTAPAAPAQAPAALPRFLQPIPPKEIQIGEKTWMLSNPGYNEVVAEIGGEVYVFDSTQGEERAALDAAAIRKLFPGQHKFNVVVTDLAWPHVAGVRYWVAQGATIIAHSAAQEFLQKVVDRRWTLAPDLLEKMRGKNPRPVRMKFVGVRAATERAGGMVRLAPIDGIGSEVALMAFLPGDKFLWASDYIQTLDGPSQYAKEVIESTKRAGIDPERVAAEHLAVTSWGDVLRAQTVGH